MFIVTLEIEAFANIENLPFGMFESLTFTLPYGSASFQQQMNMSNILSSVASGNNNDNIQIEQHISSNTISNTETS
jgi:hypothetical protein